MIQRLNLLRQILSDACHESYNVKGSRDELIRPGLSRLLALFVCIEPSQHKNGNIIVRFNGTANIEAIHSGHANIQQNEIGLIFFDLVKGIMAMGRDHYLEFFERQESFHYFTIGGIIIDDHYFAGWQM